LTGKLKVHQGTLNIRKGGRRERQVGKKSIFKKRSPWTEERGGKGKVAV